MKNTSSIELCDKEIGETHEETMVDFKPEDDIIRISDLEAIAKKVNDLPRAYDLQAYNLNLTEREQRIVSLMETVAKVALFNEFKHLKDKIQNHHHVALSVSDGIEFRENGSRIKQPRY